MSLSQMKDRMEREFAAIRADLKRIESRLSAGLPDPAEARRAQTRLRQALAVLRGLQWQPADPAHPRRGQRHCPVCRGAEPEHADGCVLADVLGE
jgi:hypothetical protein